MFKEQYHWIHLQLQPPFDVFIYVWRLREIEGGHH